MQAIVQDAYGPPEVLELREIDPPVVGDGQVLVGVRAASLHPDVWHTVRGVPFVLRIMGSGLRRPRNRVPGTDLAGVVESVGPGVTGFRPGEEVFCEVWRGNLWRNGGTFAEYAAVPEAVLVRKPAMLTFEQAAAVPNAGKIAVQGLRDEGRIRAGHRVLINGAGGGVGTLAVQIAKSYGTHVTGVDDAVKLETIRSIGADRVIDRTREDFTGLGERFDLILDIPGDHPFAEIRRALTPDGTYVLIGHDAYGRLGRRWIGSIGRFAKLLALSPFVKQLPGLRGAKDPGDRLAVVTELIEAGKVTPVIDRTFPLREVHAAIRYLEEGRAIGRVVITIGP